MTATLEINENKVFGDPVIEIMPGGPLPLARSGPFALWVDPELAAYFLSLNIVNRRLKMKVAQYANDIKNNLWRYPAEAIHFDVHGKLANGQNRLTAVTWAHAGAWFRVEFGWPAESFDVMDQCSPRGMGDVLRLHDIPDPTTAGAVLSIISKYDETAGSTRSWMNSGAANYVPSGVLAEQMYADDEAAFREAIHRGNRIHRATDNGLTRSVWGAAFYICHRVYPEESVVFFGAVENGESGNQAVQALREHALRRTLKTYRTGDRREPLENILRSFQAYLKNAKPGFVRQGGFKLTSIR